MIESQFIIFSYNFLTGRINNIQLFQHDLVNKKLIFLKKINNLYI